LSSKWVVVDYTASSHPESFAMGDPQHLATGGAEIEEPNTQDGFHSAGGDFLDFLSAVRTNRCCGKILTDYDPGGCHGSTLPFGCFVCDYTWWDGLE
jgi:hypothetical protein